MEILILLVILLFAVAVSAILFLVLLYQVVKADMHATTVENGGFKFVVKGDSLDRVLDNIDGHYVDPKSKKVKRLDERTEDDEKLKPKGFKQILKEVLNGKVLTDWLENAFGIFWISIFWPYKKLHEFEIAADKIKPESENSAIKDRILIETRSKQNYLRWRFQHPLAVLGVELGGDRWKVNFIVMMDIEITNPSIVIFNYKGTRGVLQLSDVAVANEIITFFGEEKWTYLEAVNVNKGRGSDLEKKILEINGPDEAKSPPPTPEEIRLGQMHRYGIRIRSVRIEAMDLSDSHKGLDEAATAKEQKKLLAEAREQEGIGEENYLKHLAEGQKAGEKLRREGIAEGFKVMIEQLKTGSDLSPDLLQILETHVETANLAGPDSKITHLFKGDHGIAPVLNVNQEEKT